MTVERREDQAFREQRIECWRCEEGVAVTEGGLCEDCGREEGNNPP